MTICLIFTWYPVYLWMCTSYYQYHGPVLSSNKSILYICVCVCVYNTRGYLKLFKRAHRAAEYTFNLIIINTKSPDCHFCLINGGMDLRIRCRHTRTHGHTLRGASHSFAVPGWCSRTTAGNNGQSPNSTLCWQFAMWSLGGVALWQTSLSLIKWRLDIAYTVIIGYFFPRRLLTQAQLLVSLIILYWYSLVSCPSIKQRRHCRF